MLTKVGASQKDITKSQAPIAKPPLGVRSADHRHLSEDSTLSVQTKAKSSEVLHADTLRLTNSYFELHNHVPLLHEPSESPCHVVPSRYRPSPKANLFRTSSSSVTSSGGSSLSRFASPEHSPHGNNKLW